MSDRPSLPGSYDADLSREPDWPEAGGQERDALNGRRCAVRLHGGHCTDAVTGRAYVTGCGMCWLLDFPACVGHPVCVHHSEALCREEGPQVRIETAKPHSRHGVRDAAIGLLEEALHLRMHGERAPGGDETWAEWDRKAEEFLRARSEVIPVEGSEDG